MQLTISNNVNGEAQISSVYVGCLHIDSLPACKQRQPDVVRVGRPGTLAIRVYGNVFGIVNAIVSGINFNVA